MEKKNRAVTKGERKAEDIDRLLVLRGDSCQRAGERYRLYGLFVAEAE